MADVTAFFASMAPDLQQHLERYLESDGELDAHPGDPGNRPCLILKTVGRKSGHTRLNPLLMQPWGDEFVIVASKGGSDQHPAWYLNLSAADEVAIQVKNKRYRCKWRVAEGQEREKIWAFMIEFFPSYDSYQASTDRVIPVVVLTPIETIKEKFTLP